MITYQNTGNIHINKIYGKQVDIEKINLQKYNKVMGVWKNILGDITKQTTDFQKIHNTPLSTNITGDDFKLVTMMFVDNGVL